MDKPSENLAEHGSGVSCTVHIPLSWSELHDAPRPGETLHLQNLQRLHAIEALESNSSRKDNDSPTEIELQRLDTKLNLALDLLGTLLEQNVPRPDGISVTLTADSAQWTMSEPPALHSRGRLALYLHPLLAQPVSLPGEIVAVEADGDVYQVTCNFDPMPDDSSDAFVAYVFRGHRRAIAEQRLQATTENADSTTTED